MNVRAFLCSRKAVAGLISCVALVAVWLTVPATGSPVLQRFFGGRTPQRPAVRPNAPEPATTRSGLIDTPLDVQGAPRLPRSSVQLSGRSSGGQTTLDDLVAQAIDLTSRRYLNVQQNPPYTPWQIMHGVLALRENYILLNGNQYIRALDYICSGPVFMGDCWFERTSTGGRARPYNNVPYAFEGHINQFLALLCMSNLPLDHQIRVADGGTVTMLDMIRTAQSTVNTREEITWTLWFLTHYLDQREQWRNVSGEEWSMERMLRIQIDAPVYTAPCGGCHGLFALAYARNAYMIQHGELRGTWLEADQKIQRYITAAQSMQNPDGSFSSKYFKARATAVDLDERIRTSGHMLEWLMMALPTSRLQEEWVRRGVARVATDLINSINENTELGGMYHACHSLVLYQQRMEQLRAREQSVPAQPTPLASQPDPEPAPLELPEGARVSALPQRQTPGSEAPEARRDSPPRVPLVVQAPQSSEAVPQPSANDPFAAPSGTPDASVTELGSTGEFSLPLTQEPAERPENQTSAPSLAATADPESVPVPAPVAPGENRPDSHSPRVDTGSSRIPLVIPQPLSGRSELAAEAESPAGEIDRDSGTPPGITALESTETVAPQSLPRSPEMEHPSTEEEGTVEGNVNPLQQVPQIADEAVRSVPEVSVETTEVESLPALAEPQQRIFTLTPGEESGGLGKPQSATATPPGSSGPRAATTGLQGNAVPR